ncbi:Ankyrin repeat and LEM domain-containing protein 1, partial [Orchesella cincta]
MDDAWEFKRKQVSSFFSPGPRAKSKSPAESNNNNLRRKSIRFSFVNNNESMSTSATAGDDDMCDALESFNKERVLEILRRKNIDVNRRLPNYSLSYLHLAVGFSENDPDIVEELLKHGGDPNNSEDMEDELSPMHVSIMHDFDKITAVLMKYGGDPNKVNGDGKSCYRLAVENVEEVMENCFAYFFRESRDFRKSIAVSHHQYQPSSRKQTFLHESGSDGFYTCESQLINSDCGSEHLHSIARKLFPERYEYLMTEDESCSDDSSTLEGRKKLTTIPEESGSGFSSSPGFSYFPSPSMNPAMARGITSMTAPHLQYLTDDSISITSELSCVNSTPPVTPMPTEEELQKLRQQMNQLNVPVTPHTYNVISKFNESESRLQALLTPKTGSCNFSSDLQAGNHLKTGVINSSEKFEKFLLSIFYIGKGCGKRPLQHLVEAKDKFVAMGRGPLKGGEKIDKILEIWKSGLGVIVLSVYHHSSEREANVNEACMIDAVGLVELSNLKKGSYAGTVASSWPQKTKNQLGAFLLYKCFCTFVVSEHKSFFPEDF